MILSLESEMMELGRYNTYTLKNNTTIGWYATNNMTRASGPSVPHHHNSKNTTAYSPHF
jgi:hypothetical protein